MSTYYWIGNNNTNVGLSANWSVYPLAGATLPPQGTGVPTGGDSIYFDWSGNTLSNPLYGPEGSLTGGLDLVFIAPNFELDIGSQSTPLGVSAQNIFINKKYQSRPEKGSTIPSVYIKSTGTDTTIKTHLLGNAPVPIPFGSSTAPQCVIDIRGDVRTIQCGYAYDAVTPSLVRSETIILGDTVETNLGGVDNKPTLEVAPTAQTTLIFGRETNIFTRDDNAVSGEKEAIFIQGNGVTAKVYRGADFGANCGGLTIRSSGSISSPNTLLFEREEYSGATGYDSGTRTTVANLKMLGELDKFNPVVTIDHGVDITGLLQINSGTFTVNPCQEATRTVGASSRVWYYCTPNFSTNPRVQLAPNCSFRYFSILDSGASVPDIVFDSKPLKTLFINQKVIEGYTGL